MKLTELLGANEVLPSEKLAQNFLKYFFINYEKATGCFVEMLFHSGGWTCYEYFSSNFPPHEEFTNLKEHGPMELNPFIFDRDQQFQKAFSAFVELIFIAEKSMLLYHEYFMGKVVGAFNVLVTGNWDSFRLVALILGTKLLVCLDKEYECLRGDAKFPDAQKEGLNFNSVFCRKRDFLSLPWRQIFVKIYSSPQLCAYHSPGRSYRFKQTGSHVCFIHELHLWAVTTPTTPINDEWLPTILLAMRDSSTDNKWIAVTALYQLFKHPLAAAYQRKVFNYVKSDLLYLLKSRSEVTEICLRILNSCIRYLDVSLSCYEMETILYYLYDSSQLLSALAAEFVYWSQFVPLISDPVAVVVQLVEINRESFVKSEDLIVDSLYHLVKVYLTWNDWITIIKNAADEDVPDYARMLAAFARKAATGFIPRIRKCRVSPTAVKSEEEDCSTSNFTRLFAEYWFMLLEVRKVSENPKATASLLKIIQYFDSSLLSCIETVVNLAQVCLALLVITEDGEVIEESCHSLHSLKCLTMSSESPIPALSEVIDAAIQQGLLDFQNSKDDEFNASFELVQRKMLALTKYFEVGDSSLWWLSFDTLRSMLMSKIDQQLKTKTIVTSMNLLFQLLMRKIADAAKEVSIDQNSISSNVLITCCMSRTAALQAVLKYFLDSQYNNQVRKMACRTLMDLLEYMGPHIPFQKRLWALHLSFDEEEVNVLISYVTEMMESNKSCLHLLLEDAKLSNCCAIICKTCDFIARGLLDIHCLTPLLRCIGRCSTHDEVVMEAVNKYSINFPNRWELLAVSILNAYVIMLEDAMPAFPSIEESPHRYNFSHLYMSLLNLTQYLVGRNKFENKNIMKLMSIRLHIHLIEVAMRPEGPRAVLELLYAVRDTLAVEDVNLVISFLQQYAPDSGPDFTKYYNFMKQSIPKKDFHANLGTTSNDVTLPIS